ncbi:MAG: PH domain-containing protein [Bryobacteraceae bacterium]
MAVSTEPTPEVVLRPSIKLVQVGYVSILILASAIFAYWKIAAPPPAVEVWWPLIVPAILLLWALQRHIARRTTRLSIVGDRLRYEAGVFTKTSRTMEIHKVQDVRVDQTIGQRVLGIGNLSIETAGEASRITMENIDAPPPAAERILDLARHHK